jgi:2-oxoglutarate dehydrogenase E1 component
LEIYLKKLEEEQVLPSIDYDMIRKNIMDRLDVNFDESKSIEKADIISFLGSLWKEMKKPALSDFDSSPDTTVDATTLIEIGRKITSLPEGIKFFRKIIKLQEDRKGMLEPGARFDWAMGELLAYGSLLKEGFPVRLSGQDSQRGTFSHRHSVFTIEDSEEKYTPLANIDPNQAKFFVYNSPLSEYGVLGFDFGYAFGTPFGLTIWEAQFGDFNNGAQIIIDQYISSAEDKWKVMNGLVLYLPHGYEGQGPEHSSARMERFLSICGHENIQVVNCTTPANFFHVLRRQLYRPFRKPLIIFTPKSLLRHPKCVSHISEFTSGGFKEVLDDLSADPDLITRIVFCSGKVYYDILEEKEKVQKNDFALIRIEQLYPLPLKQLKIILLKYSNADRWEWIQEEPANMGAWKFINQNFVLPGVPGFHLYHTARPPTGSPATGSSKLHKIQQSLIVQKAMGKCTCEAAHTSCKLHCAESEEQII